ARYRSDPGIAPAGERGPGHQRVPQSGAESRNRRSCEPQRLSIHAAVRRPRGTLPLCSAHPGRNPPGPRAPGCHIGPADQEPAGPLTVNHQGQLPAVTIFFNLAPGVSLGDAIQNIQDAERRIGLPATVTAGFSGTAQVFQQALRGQGWLLLATVVVIYIVLGI